MVLGRDSSAGLLPTATSRHLNCSPCGSLLAHPFVKTWPRFSNCWRIILINLLLLLSATSASTWRSLPASICRYCRCVLPLQRFTASLQHSLTFQLGSWDSHSDFVSRWDAKKKEICHTQISLTSNCDRSKNGRPSMEKPISATWKSFILRRRSVTTADSSSTSAWEHWFVVMNIRKSLWSRYLNMLIAPARKPIKFEIGRGYYRLVQLRYCGLTNQIYYSTTPDNRSKRSVQNCHSVLIFNRAINCCNIWIV